ncbi:hypothetical protein [Cellvibrio sp. PSBB023]|uniref:hypothetical protein n=1 Tax=Cellvibrio sp. PSBB023 TaxID=1945512 RepID=UPI001439571F|nr:hypothetical protein [Cellvibrio sp. PSBB023]
MMEEKLARLKIVEDSALQLRRAVSDFELNGMLSESKALFYVEVLNQIEADLVSSIHG